MKGVPIPTATEKSAPAAVKTLREIVLFRDFSDQELGVFQKIVVEKKLPKGTPLYVENMLGETMFIIKSGKVKVSKNLRQLGEKMLLQLKSGEFFGEMALFDSNAQRLTSAVCLEDTDLYLIQAEDFKKFMGAEPALALKFLSMVVRIFGQRLRKNDGFFCDFFIWQLTPR